MYQIRILWRRNVRHSVHFPKMLNAWWPSTPELLEQFEGIVYAANEIHGPGTHWIERRQVEVLH
ncbi:MULTISPECIES: hypothetical protein [unclassified Methylibium]|uniref:hypothetical protein n=1 Tax=unclassified Methylibium TaxID=2633235 RepID=UPI0003F45252|nr:MULTISPECIES: hypothetical protein [unclassified Methylibium]EWS54896.1 hypothetical protein X551_02291 [Methylibium sp. T29]EWS61750.1 hypothetical protein Y694_00536 [Methylibium sp. T29-B]